MILVLILLLSYMVFKSFLETISLPMLKRNKCLKLNNTVNYWNLKKTDDVNVLLLVAHPDDETIFSFMTKSQNTEIGKEK